MKKEFFILAVLAVLAVFLISLVSADIVIVQNPSNLYNLGDMISVPVKITSLTDVGNPFTIKLICNGVETEVHREYILLSSGGETERNPPIPLIKDFIGDLKGDCNLKYLFGTEFKLSSDFVISDLININLTIEQKDFSPGEEITIEGVAKKKNGKEVNGFAEMEIISENESNEILASNTVKNGLFTLIFSFPKETASGNYPIKINVYEKDSKGETTNYGSTNYNIFIKQISSSLEIFMENNEVEPEEVFKTKTILHDQAGQSISSTVLLTLLNSKNKIMEQKELATEEFLEFTVPQSELPGAWTIKAESNGLISQDIFKIKEQEKISTEIIGDTLIIKNIGNIPYNKSVLVKIGENPVNVDVNLDIGEYKKYSLSAPDGEYPVDVITNGKSNLNKSVLLTGKTVDVQESGVFIGDTTIIWIIVIILLAFFGMRLFKRWYKKSFFGYLPGKNAVAKQEIFEGKKETIPLKKGSVITRNKAELELSIKGDKQDISLVCLKIKNFDKLKQSKTEYNKVIQNLVEIAEQQKACIYGAQENIFFIYAPVKTKTFKNERAALELAHKISGVIDSYNKLAKEKINSGLSVSYGAIIASLQRNILKFMALGTLMNSSKKLASISDGEVLLSEKMREKLGADVKTNKKEVNGVIAYTVKEVRNDERTQEFIRRFMDRMDRGK